MKKLATAGAVVGLLCYLTPQATAAPPEVEVIELAGETSETCDETIRYTSGQVRIVWQEVISPSGARLLRYQEHVSGAAAVGEESGLVYRDITQLNWSTTGNPTWNETQFEDGSHGVNAVLRIRVMAPGSDARTLEVSEAFHLRRVDGYYTEPRMVHESYSETCT